MTTPKIKEATSSTVLEMLDSKKWTATGILCLGVTFSEQLGIDAAPREKAVALAILIGLVIVCQTAVDVAEKLSGKSASE